MHELGRHVQAAMDERGWRASDLARASGVSKEVLSTLLSQSRTSLTRPPSAATIKGIAAALGGARTEDVLWLRVAQSMGLPVGDAVTVPDVNLLRDEELLAELRRRLLSRTAERTNDEPRTTTQPVDLAERRHANGSHESVTGSRQTSSPPPATGKAARRRRGSSRDDAS